MKELRQIIESILNAVRTQFDIVFNEHGVIIEKNDINDNEVIQAVSDANMIKYIFKYDHCIDAHISVTGNSSIRIVV